VLRSPEGLVNYYLLVGVSAKFVIFRSRWMSFHRLLHDVVGRNCGHNVLQNIKLRFYGRFGGFGGSGRVWPMSPGGNISILHNSL